MPEHHNLENLERKNQKIQLAKLITYALKANLDHGLVGLRT